MKERVIKLLNEQDNSIELAIRLPHDFKSLRERIYQLELKQEIEALRMMLLDANTFDEQFKKRCHWRATAIEHGISFSDMPESMTNQLYWHIATILFKPNQLKDMLQIVLPHIKVHLSVSLPESLPIGVQLNEWKQRMDPVLITSNSLDALSEPPTLESLTHYVQSGDMIFDVEDIAGFPLSCHVKVWNLLSKKYPELAKQVYNHNSALQTLASDIHLFNNQGITPKEVIEQFIQQLILSGTRVTGNYFASQAAEIALRRFFDYFNALLPETKKHLRELKGDNRSLGAIIDEELEKGHCVESTSSYLSQILQNNKQDVVLHLPPRMTPADLKKLENQYKAKHNEVLLTTRKDNVLISVLPAQLTRIAIQGIAPKTHEELVVLLLNFPPTYYDSLWEHIIFNDPKKEFKQLSTTIKMGFFNSEQRQALAKAIASHYQRFHLEQSILFWAIKINDSLFLNEVTSFYQEKQRLDLVTVVNQKGKTPLHSATKNPESLKVILALLPEDKRLDIVKGVNHEGEMLLHSAAKNPQSLKIILALYPEDERLGAVKVVNQKGKTPLFSAVKNSESLKAILALYPENQRLNAVKIMNKTGKTPLHSAVKNHESFNILLALYPENQRLDAVSLVNEEGITPLYSAYYYPESLIVLLTQLPVYQRLDAVKIVNRVGETLLHPVLYYHEFLHGLLTLIPENQRLEAVTIAHQETEVLLHAALLYPQSLKVIMELLPENQRLDAVRIKNKIGATLLDSAVTRFESLKVILIFMPENQRLILLQTIVCGQSVVSRLVEQKTYILSSEDELESSSVPAIISLSLFLAEQGNTLNSNIWEAIYTMYHDGLLPQEQMEALHWAGPEEIRELIRHIDTMVTHGLFLLDCDVEKGKIALLLALDLKKQLNDFFKKSPLEQQQSKKQFQVSFIKQLQDNKDKMSIHREYWKVIIANILIAFTGLGLFAIAAHFLLNGRGFFSQTKREQLLETMQSSSWLASPV